VRSALFRSETKALLQLAAPLAAAHAGQSLMSLVDTAVVGRLGSAPLGAIGLSNALFFFFCVLGMGLMMGVDPLIAQAIGAREEQRAKAVCIQGLYLALITGVALTFPLLAAPLVLGWFGITEDLSRLTTATLYWRLPSLVPFLMFFVMRSTLQSFGRAAPMVWATVAANFANLGLDILFVFGSERLGIPSMGAAGASLATSLCTVLQLAILLAFALSGAENQAGGARLPLRPNRKDLWMAARVGLPVGLQLMAEVGLFALAGLLAGRFGEVSLAAHQVALTVATFSFTAATGLGNAGTVRVGQAVGAQDAGRTRAAGSATFLLCTAWMGFCAALFLFLPRPIASLLTNQPAVIDAAAPLLLVVAAFQLSDGLQAVGAGVLRGAGDTRFPFVANVLGHYLVGFPLALGLGVYGGQELFGVWWGLCGGLTAVAGALVWRFLRLSSQPIRRLERAQAA
jgi:MATE family multidrug resistance protein